MRPSLVARLGKTASAASAARGTRQARSPAKSYRALRISERTTVSPYLRNLERTHPTIIVKDSVLASGSGHVISGRWLRDQCSCPECRNVETAQRKVNVLKNKPAGEVAKARKVDSYPSVFEVTFKDGHTTTISESAIQEHWEYTQGNMRSSLREVKYWGSNINRNPPEVKHEAISKGQGMADLLAKIRTFGFCFVDNMPATPEASQSLLEQIGPIRNTHYGGFYDFTSDLSSKDTAYTSESLEPHTDTTYFTDPIGLQALHLLSHTSGSGGLSSLVDGFSIARDLFSQNPKAYETLSSKRVFAHASGNEGVNIQPAQAFPVLGHTRTGGALHQVRWNTADRAWVAAPLSGAGSVDSWYDAAADFDARLSDPKNQYWFQLQPGRMLIFDNWRVLHGRSAFTGKRRMCGGYINRDDFISKYRMTNLSEEEIEMTKMTG